MQKTIRQKPLSSQSSTLTKNTNHTKHLPTRPAKRPRRSLQTVPRSRSVPNTTPQVSSIKAENNYNSIFIQKLFADSGPSTVTPSSPTQIFDISITRQHLTPQIGIIGSQTVDKNHNIDKKSSKTNLNRLLNSSNYNNNPHNIFQITRHNHSQHHTYLPMNQIQSHSFSSHRHKNETNNVENFQNNSKNAPKNEHFDHFSHTKSNDNSPNSSPSHLPNNDQSQSISSTQHTRQNDQNESFLSNNFDNQGPFFSSHLHHRPRLTHLSFSHRPRVITLDITGTLLTPKKSISELYAESALKVGINVENNEKLSESFKNAYKQCNELYPNFGHGQLPSSRNWWYQVVIRTFVNAGYNVPYEQQDLLFEQIYTDFGLSEHYYIYNDVLPFLQFIQKYNNFVKNSKNQNLLYEQQRDNLRTCLITNTNNNPNTILSSSPLSSSDHYTNTTDEETELCLNSHAYLHYNPILIGIISNGDCRYQDSILPLLTLSNYINFYVISEREGNQKPHYSMFDRARTKANQLSNYLGYNCYNNDNVMNYSSSLINNNNNNNDNNNNNNNNNEEDDNHNNNPSCNTSSIKYEDVLHIGDSLNEDIIGAKNANFDHVYLIRNNEYEKLLGEYLNDIKLITNNNNNNNNNDKEYEKMNLINNNPKYEKLFNLEQIENDYNDMQSITYQRLLHLQKNKNINFSFGDYNIDNPDNNNNNNNNNTNLDTDNNNHNHNNIPMITTTFRNLLQVRDAYFHDIIDKL